MDKKKYIVPEIEVVELVSDVVMQISSKLHDDEDDWANPEDQLSNNRRGRWGDLWDKNR